MMVMVLMGIPSGQGGQKRKKTQMHGRLWSTVWVIATLKEQINTPTAYYLESTWSPQPEGGCTFTENMTERVPRFWEQALVKAITNHLPGFRRLVWESISVHVTPESGDTLVALNFTSWYNCNIKINLPDWLSRALVIGMLPCKEYFYIFWIGVHIRYFH